MIKEILTANNVMQELLKNEGSGGNGPLVDDVLATIRGMSPDEVKGNAMQFESRDPASARQEIQQVVADGVAALPGAEQFKQWILDLAREVAATSTDGLLGIGARSVVDEQEQAALKELTGA